MVNFIILISSFMTTLVFAQESPYSEEYMEKHDGGDRAEYLQEMEYSDPLFSYFILFMPHGKLSKG